MDSITFKTDTGKEYHLETDRMHPYILSAGSPSRVEKIAEYLESSKIEEGDRKLTVVHGRYEGLPVSAFTTGMGPASASIVIPEAIERSEGDITMLRLGTAGALQPYVESGDIVTATGAIRDEGTTEAAVGSEFPSFASPELVPIIIAAAEKHGYEFEENLWAGIIHVKDDLYFKETPQFSPSKESLESRLEAYKRMGALSSSMEFSVYTVMRDYYEARRAGNIKVGALLAIVSEAREGSHVQVDKDAKGKLETDMIKIGLDVLKLADDLRSGETPEIDLTKTVGKMLQSSSRKKLREDQPE